MTDYLGIKEVQSRVPIKPRITRGAWRKIEYFGDLPVKIFKGAYESKRFLLVRLDDPHLIRDVYYPEQRISGGDVEVEADEFFKMVEDTHSRGYLLRGWEHIHPYFGNFSSEIDRSNNKLILAQIPLELRVTENKPAQVTINNEVVDANVNLYTTYMVSIIHNPTIPNPSLVERVNRVAEAVIDKVMDLGNDDLDDDDLLDSRINHDPYVEIAFKRWTDFFTPDDYNREKWRLDIVDVEDDISFEPELWAKEVRAKTRVAREYGSFRDWIKGE